MGSIGDAMIAAESEAWAALELYKFWMFGYHASVWMTLNRLDTPFGEGMPNAFRLLVKVARAVHREGDIERIICRSKDGPRIVCLCGSGRFKAAFDQAEFDETLAGRIVLTIGCNCYDVARSEDLKQHKPMLDELHLRKIDLADEVLVLNVRGYIGESTAREIAYAEKTGKPVRWLEPKP